MTFGGRYRTGHRSRRASPSRPPTQIGARLLGGAGPSSTASSTRRCSRRAPTRRSASPTEVRHDRRTDGERRASPDMALGHGDRAVPGRSGPGRWRCSKNQLELATRANLQEAVAIAEFLRGLVLFTRSSLRRMGGRDAASARRQPRHGQPPRHAQRALGRHGPGRPRGRSEAAAALLRGTASGPRRVRTSRLRERALRRGEDRQNTSNADRATRMRHHVRRLDIEATIDLALDTLDDIAADERA